MDLFTLPGATFQSIEWFRAVLQPGISWHQCESIVKLILEISSFHVFEQPVESVFNETQEQLMQFIRLPKPIDVAERVLPELVADWADTESMQSINIIVLQLLRVNMLVSGVIKWSKSSMPHWRTFRNFTHPG